MVYLHSKKQELMLNKTNLTIVFFIVFVAQLFSLLTENEWIRFITKPLITLVLMLSLVMLNQLYGKFRKRIFIGLIFGLLGDVFLMLPANHPSYFMLGLLSFLIGHLFYISAFNLDIQSSTKKASNIFLITSIVLAIFSGAFFLYLRPFLGSLQLPVLIYCFIISLMVMLSIGRWGKVDKSSALFITIGAFFFLISDSLLAYNKFVLPLENSGLYVMSTYMLAQYFIVQGTINRVLISKEEN